MALNPCQPWPLKRAVNVFVVVCASVALVPAGHAPPTLSDPCPTDDDWNNWDTFTLQKKWDTFDDAADCAALDPTYFTTATGESSCEVTDTGVEVVCVKASVWVARDAAFRCEAEDPLPPAPGEVCYTISEKVEGWTELSGVSGEAYLSVKLAAGDVTCSWDAPGKHCWSPSDSSNRWNLPQSSCFAVAGVANAYVINVAGIRTGYVGSQADTDDDSCD